MEGITIQQDGKLIVLNFQTLGEALKLWQPWNDGKRRTEVTEILHLALAAAGLSVEVRVQGKPVAQLGGHEMTGLALTLVAQSVAR